MEPPAVRPPPAPRANRFRSPGRSRSGPGGQPARPRPRQGASLASARRRRTSPSLPDSGPALAVHPATAAGGCGSPAEVATRGFPIRADRSPGRQPTRGHTLHAAAGVACVGPCPSDPVAEPKSRPAARGPGGAHGEPVHGRGDSHGDFGPGLPGRTAGARATSARPPRTGRWRGAGRVRDDNEGTRTA